VVRTKAITVRITFLVIIIFSFIYSKGVDESVRMQQVCLNRLDSMVTIKWKTRPDNCGSFQEYRLFGRDELFAPYTLLQTLTDINQNQINFKLPNIKQWEFFIITRFACDGISQWVSDTMKVDFEQPIEWELDSVSVDIVTQKTILGWSNHPAEDSEGYFVYYVGANNILLKDTNSLFFKDTLQGNPQNQSEQYSLATYDSCGNTSPISGGHKTIFLQGNFDTCDRKITLNWTDYEPLNALRYRIRTSSDSFTNFEVHDSVSALSYSFENVAPGERYCFVIQMLSDNGITSSSNRVCFETPLPIGAPNHIYKVTVNEEQDVEIHLRSELAQGTISIIKSQNNGLYSLFKEFKAETFTGDTILFDRNLEVGSHSFFYQIVHRDQCDYSIPLDSSNISNTILLTVIESNIEAELDWTSYNTFLEGVGQYHIYKQYGLEILPRSTWNLIDVLNPNQNKAFDVYLNQEYAYKLCYVVSAIEENENIFGRQDTSFSNSVCYVRELSIYFPTAFAPEGINTTFKPIGIGIDETTEESILEIYNRWGEKIFVTNKITEGWDGKKKDGETYPPGTYVYYAKIKGELGEFVEFKGTIILLK